MSCYKIVPNRHCFLDFMVTLELSPEQRHCVETFPIRFVEVDEERNTWKINYDAAATPLEQQELAAVAKKLAAACSVAQVTFVNQNADNLAAPCLEDQDIPLPPEPSEEEEPPLPDEPPEEDQDFFQSEEYQKALASVASQTAEGRKKDGVVYGRKITKKARTMAEVVEEENGVVVEGTVVGFDERELRTGAIMLTIKVADDTEGLFVKIRFGQRNEGNDIAQNRKECAQLQQQIPEGTKVKMQGNITVDKYANSELVMVGVKGIMVEPSDSREDHAETKRVELHCHTKMSKMDGLTPIEKLVDTAVAWGHKALALTDHGVVQAFPFAYDEAKKLRDKNGWEIKLIYGCEGYLCHSREDKKNYHIILLAKNVEGLRNLYRLVSLSHLQYFGGKPKRPRLTKGLLDQYRDGIIVGSACAAGEVYRAILAGVDHEELKEIASYYDYLEIQPTGNNNYLIRDPRFPNITSVEDLQDINRQILALGDELGKMTVATCDVHFLNPEDALARKILQAGMGYSDEEQPPLYFRTTEEMLAEFDYLGDRACEVVVENPNKINDMVERFKPVPDRDQLYSPSIPGAKEKVQSLSYAQAHAWYGPKLPKIVEDRLKLELSSIIGNGFSVLYYIAHLLVKKSNDDGYMVGSRGSVGSSFVATMLNITEVNPLVPHYRCPHCFHTEFFTDGSVESGFDLPEKNCPECGTPMIRDGHNIPFAVFLGFHGDKVPDIDLNFSGEYQPRAHKYTEELFGRDNVFRAGTLGTIKDKTAYGYIKKYYETRGEPKRTAFIESLIPKLAGVKRTTGQHPGGIVVIPRNLDVHYITPVSHPADDPECGTITTHYDFHSIDERIVKLDILGHDDPTVIKMLDRMLGEDYCKHIPIGDKDTMELFLSTKSLGVTPEQIGTDVATYGVPECGTRFVRQMISDVKPKNFSDLLRISGYSHGTDVWLNNAQDLIRAGTPTEDTISTRDDIMNWLINKGMEPSMAFGIMEWSRKGKAHKKGFKPEQLEAFKKAHIPEFYIKACTTLQYLFPKAHAVAYVLSAYRIAYCKVHHPREFYAAYFTVRAPHFDYALVHKGLDYMKRFIRNVTAQGTKASVNDKDAATYMELCVEMLERGFVFENVDLYKSDAHRFLVTEKGLLPPLGAIGGIGGVAAEGIVEARKKGPFISQEDLRNRAKISTANVEILDELGILEGMPKTDQIELF
ncbi:PolC-type DNA polymerase III [Acidaminococcus timonensis]|uniref:PolC-type DNA polymerase III n=1 Tax=Acidaminococcus timonensis TaxID=1871002 RepID=UPI002943BB7E|nr:PolC-type DNA polymerase III [Acidaminococcus timonensis]